MPRPVPGTPRASPGGGAGARPARALASPLWSRRAPGAAGDGSCSSPPPRLERRDRIARRLVIGVEAELAAVGGPRAAALAELLERQPAPVVGAHDGFVLPAFELELAQRVARAVFLERDHAEHLV